MPPTRLAQVQCQQHDERSRQLMTPMAEALATSFSLSLMMMSSGAISARQVPAMKITEPYR